MTIQTNVEQKLWKAIQDGMYFEAGSLLTRCWRDGLAPAISAEVLRHIGDPTGWDVMWQAAKSEAVKRSLMCAVETAPLESFAWRSSLGVTLLSIGDIETRVFDAEGHGTADARVRAIQEVTASLLGVHGRTKTREHVQRWWKRKDLLEEQREAIISALGRAHALTRSFVRTLGMDAERIAASLISRHGIDGSWFGDLASLAELGGAKRRSDQAVVARVGSLLQSVQLVADIRDARFSPGELGRLNGGRAKSLLARAVRRYHPRQLYELLHEIGIESIPMTSLLFRDSVTEKASLEFPLIRLLHLRLIVESPSLASSLLHPERLLVPEVMLYLLGQDAVSYFPQLRVHRETDRRWRARWAEATAEAVSIMLLEDVLDMELSKLARIRERVEGPTADFRAKTRSGDKVVFESKGTTDWGTHRAQRRHAAEQLGKVQKRRGLRTGDLWRPKVRTYAVCLYASQQGRDGSSLLYVDDPPFEFDDLFGEANDDSARRHHYAAVLQAARMFDVADAVLAPRTEAAEVKEDASVFTIRTPGTQEAGVSFRGNYLPLLEVARQLGHPDHNSVRNVGLFVGIRDAEYRSLMRGNIPESTETTDELSPTGLLPGADSQAAPCGVYSLLSDGAFLAVEVS